MKVILKSNRKTVEFVDGITQINANDVMWQFFKIKLEVPLALRESLWVTFKNQANDEEFTHPFLASLASTGEYYAQIPADVIRNAGVWEFQLFIRQYSTTGTGKYVQYASNKYSFTVEQGLPVSALNAPVDNATISALFRTSNEIIKRFYGVKNVMTAYAKVHAYKGVKIKNVTGCALIDWGDGTIEDGNGKTDTIYSHTYTTAGNYAVRLFNVTNIGESAFEEFSAIYDLELNNSLLSIGKNAFKNSLIDKLCIPMSVEYLADCFTETDLIRAVELKQYDPSAFSHNAFKHFLLNLPFECKVVVPTYAVDAYTNAYITEERPMMFAMRAYETEGLEYGPPYELGDGTMGVTVFSKGTATDTEIIIPQMVTRTIDGEDIPCYVTRISIGAFENEETIKTVYAYNIKYVMDNAFKGCTALENVYLEEAERIGYNAFDGCTSLKALVIPDTVTTIDTAVLKGCTAIEELTFKFCGPNENALQPLAWLFASSTGSAVPASLKTVTVTGDKLANQMFSGCSNIETVSLGVNITDIPIRAFAGCTSLTVAPCENATKIGSYAFLNSGVISAEIHAEEIGAQAFQNSKLEAVTIYGYCSIGSYAFQTNGTLNTVYVKSSTPPTLGTDVFKGASTELYIVVPYRLGDTYKNASGWKNYANYIVEEKPQLKTPTVTISADGLASWYSANASGYVYEIRGKGSTTVTASETSVYLENGEAIRVMARGGANYKNSPYSSYQTYTAQNTLAFEIVNNTHYKVVGIGTVTGETVTIPTSYRGKTVKAIGASAFAENTTITSVIIPTTITEIAENAFSNCSGLTTIDLPASIVYVGAQAFSGTSISTLDLPSSIQTIARNAFNTETLKTVNVVSYSPCYIEENAFGTSIETIAVPYGTGDLYKNAWTAYADVIQEVEQAINYELSADGTYYIVTGTDDNISATLNIPDTYEGLPVKAISADAFKTKQFERIYLPNSLNKIGARAFLGCLISTITIPANVAAIEEYAFANCSYLKTVDVQATIPPTIGNSIFANTALTEIVVPEQSLTLYVSDSQWKAYSQFFPNYNQGGGDSGGNGDSGDSGGNEGGGDDEDDGGGGGVVKPLQTLLIPIVTITSDGLAMWYAENATAYEFVIDGSTPVMTTATQMQLMDGQSVKVRAIGDGITYGNSAYSDYYLYNAVIYDGADNPILPEYSDVDITRNVFDRYAFISELEEVNNQKEFEEVNKRIDGIQNDVESRVEKSSQANRLYGTDNKGKQTTYSLDDVGTQVLVNGVKVKEFNANTKQDVIAFDSVYDKNANKAATVKTVDNAISTHNSGEATHKDIRNLISELSNRLNALADSDDTTLDQLSEVVAYIKANKALIESVTTSKVNVSDIINDLETNVANKPLSASQGVALKALIDALGQSVNGLAETVDGLADMVDSFNQDLADLTDKTDELEEYSIRDVSLGILEDNELSVKLKDKEGNIVASAETTLPMPDLTDYVKNTDYATNDTEKYGLVKLKAYGAGGFKITNGYLSVQEPSISLMRARDYARPLVSANIDDVVYLGVTGYKTVWNGSLGQNVGSYGNQKPLTDEEKASACDWLGAMPIVVPSVANRTYLIATGKNTSGKIEYFLKDFNDIATKEYVDNLVGDIESVLTAILGV